MSDCHNTNYTERTHCIFCESELTKTYFENDYTCPVAHYSVPLNEEGTEIIPFNVSKCSQCFTLQNKYLGEAKEIYRINHADSTGTTMMGLHQTTRSILLKYKDDIKTGIVEIGSSLGVLADLIIEELPEIQYTIVEPCFYGNRENKRVFDDFFENIDSGEIRENVLIISHVFEHFYHPVNILNKIRDCSTIDSFLLVFPDLEYYMQNNVYHVLNTEHTYYVDNDFLVKQIERTLGFELVEMSKYKNHSVIFYFRRKIQFANVVREVIDETLPKVVLSPLQNIHHMNVEPYFSDIFKKVGRMNEIIEKHKETHSIYLFPASIHSLYLTTFGLSNDFTGYLDNSKNKIGEKMYGTGKPIFNFAEIVAMNPPNTIVFLNGGIFNDEVLHKIREADNISIY